MQRYTGGQGQPWAQNPGLKCQCFSEGPWRIALQNGLQLLSMWAAKKSGEPCQRSAHTLLPEQPQLTPEPWLTSLQHSKGSAVPTTATQLPLSHSWGTEIMERKFNHLLWFPPCRGKKLWARKHRWIHNWLLISTKGSSNCLHWDQHLWQCMISALTCSINRRKCPSTTASGTRDNCPANMEQGSGWSAHPRDAGCFPCWGHCIAMEVIPQKNLPALCHGQQGCSAAPKAFSSKSNSAYSKMQYTSLEFTLGSQAAHGDWWSLAKSGAIRFPNPVLCASGEFYWHRPGALQLAL